MKKLAYTILFTAAVMLSACNASTSKTGGDVADSGANHGSSGPADSVGVVSPGSAAGAAGTDTGTTGGNIPNPATDTGRHRP